MRRGSRFFPLGVAVEVDAIVRGPAPLNLIPFAASASQILGHSRVAVEDSSPENSRWSLSPPR